MQVETSRFNKFLAELISQARAQKRSTLLETEGMQILSEAGFTVPSQLLVQTQEQIQKLSFPLFCSKERQAQVKVILKAVSPTLLHKTEAGAVAVVSNTQADVLTAFEEMSKRLKDHAISTYTLNEFIPHTAFLGEFLVCIKNTADFGPLLTLSAGGVHAEFLAHHLKEGSELAVFSPEWGIPKTNVDRLAWVKLTTTSQRGKPPTLLPSCLKETLQALLELAPLLTAQGIEEFEINPMVIDTRTQALVPLDALVKLNSAPSVQLAAPKPTFKIKNLLEPKTMALVGVSEKANPPNPGRVILQNTLAEGYSPSHIFIIKPDCAEIQGCKCVPSISALPAPVDLLVVAVSAAQVPAVIQEVCESQKAESLIVIPGGLEEKAGTATLVAAMNKSITQARSSSWRGPVMNGGNCLGVYSELGRYNTLFIPGYKAPARNAKPAPLAFISQSGAFGISRIDQLERFRPRVSLSIGNQMDLTAGDYLHFLKEDPSLRVFAIYLEGFKPGDGRHFLKAAQEITHSGRPVILYRSGRTPEGAHASASHTASIASDYAITRELAKTCGITLADTFEEFEDLISLFTLLSDRPAKGRSLGAASNAGFECVNLGDRIDGLKLASLGNDTIQALQKVLDENRLSGIVDIHHPFDLTPMANDIANERVFDLILSDPAVDVGVLGLVPLTPALNTRAASTEHVENVHDQGAIASRLKSIRNKAIKPFVVVVDSGRDYEPLCSALRDSGIPTFPHMDRALKSLNAFCSFSERLL